MPQTRAQKQYTKESDCFHGYKTKLIYRSRKLKIILEKSLEAFKCKILLTKNENVIN